MCWATFSRDSYCCDMAIGSPARPMRLFSALRKFHCFGRYISTMPTPFHWSTLALARHLWLWRRRDELHLFVRVRALTSPTQFDKCRGSPGHWGVPFPISSRPGIQQIVDLPGVSCLSLGSFDCGMVSVVLLLQICACVRVDCFPRFRIDIITHLVRPNDPY